MSLKDLWGSWRQIVSKSLISFWDLLVKAIICFIWLERNAPMFTDTCLSPGAIIMKTDCMLLLWLSAAPDLKKMKLEDPMLKIKKSLDFLSTTDVVLDAPSVRSTSLGDI